MSTSSQCTIELANEFASIRLTLDTRGNGPRVRVQTNRNSREVFLDPVAFDLLCHANDAMFDLLADSSRDDEALGDFAAIRRERGILR
jgi:hypothetical protein